MLTWCILLVNGCTIAILVVKENTWILISRLEFNSGIYFSFIDPFAKSYYENVSLDEVLV